MLLAPSSSAANCTRWSTPDFETPYAPNQRCVLLLAIDEIATMDPPPPATSARAPCLIVSMVPVTLRSTVRRQASTSSCVTGAMVSFPPAQATTPSSFPVTDTAAADSGDDVCLDRDVGGGDADRSFRTRLPDRFGGSFEFLLVASADRDVSARRNERTSDAQADATNRRRSPVSMCRRKWVCPLRRCRRPCVSPGRCPRRARVLILEVFRFGFGENAPRYIGTGSTY